MVIAIVAITLAKLEFQKKGKKSFQKKKITSQNFSYFSYDFFHKYITYEKWFHEICTFQVIEGLCFFYTRGILRITHTYGCIFFFN